MKHLRVAVVASSHIAGGAEEYLYRLYKQFSSNFDVTVTLIGELPDWPAEFNSIRPAHNVKITSKRSTWTQLFYSFLSALQIIFLVWGRRRNIDVVHMQYFHAKLFVTRFLPPRIRVIWTEHGPLPSNLPRAAVRLYKWQSRRATTIAVSSGVSKSLSLLSISSATIWNPLPDAPSPGRCGGARAPMVFYAGRVHEAKRVELLVKAAREMQHVAFVIAGDGPDRLMVQENAPPNVRFLGHVDNVDEWMDRAGAVVLTSGKSAREGSPLVMLEARSKGIETLVATDSDAAEEAYTLGCKLYDPRVQDLVEQLSASLSCVSTPIAEEIRQLRSLENWARLHHRLFTGEAAP